MTGGIAIILGDFGRNFAAGMSGGIAYLYNEQGFFDEKKFNFEMVELEDLQESDFESIQKHLKNHIDYTKSPKATEILNDWSRSSKNFIKVMPTDYKRALEMMVKKQTEKTV
jgi:glutamate synthase (ferredoxin)